MDMALAPAQAIYEALIARGSHGGLWRDSDRRLMATSAPRGMFGRHWWSVPRRRVAMRVAVRAVACRFGKLG